MIKKEMSVLDAFIALEDLEDEEIQMPLKEGKGFNVRSTQDMEKAKEFVESEQTKEVALEVIDVDADSLEHLKNNTEYVGQMILQCNSCNATRFIDANDLVESEADSSVYNVDDECPHCHGTGTGFHLLGQVGKVTEEEPTIENDSLTDEATFDNDVEETRVEEPAEETPEVEEESEEEYKEPEEDMMETEAEDDTADMESTLGDEFNPDDSLKTEEETSEEKAEEDSLTKEEEDEYDEPLKTIEEPEEEKEEDKKKEKKESLEEDIDTSVETVSELFDTIVEPDTIEDVVIFDLDSDDPEEEIFRGPFEDIPSQLLDSEFVGFTVAQGMLLVNIDSSEEIDELTPTVKTALDKFTDEFNSKVSVWDQAEGEEVFEGTKQSVLEQFGHNAFLSFEAPERIEISVRKAFVEESLKTAYNESLDLAEPEDKLISDILAENKLKEYNVRKYGTEEYWIADSIRNLEDLDHIWEQYIENKSESLKLEFEDVTGFGVEDDEIDEALDSESEDALITKAKDALKTSGDFAVIYAYQKNGKVYPLPELIFAKDQDTLADKTEIVTLRFKPTGSIRVLYNKDVHESVDYKNRKDLSEAILECESKGIQYSIKRSVKEGFRYTLIKESPEGFFQPEEVEEVETEVVDPIEQPAEVEQTTTAVIDPRDAALVEKLTRIAHDTAQAISDSYGVEVDERVILSDMIQDLQLVSGQISPEELENTPINNLTKEMFDAYTGFYEALDELVSFVTGEPITTTTAQKIQQAIASLDSEEFSTEAIKEKIKDPSFLLAMQQGSIPGITFNGDPSEIRLLNGPEEVEEDLTIKVSPEEVVINDGEEDVAVIPTESAEEKVEEEVCPTCGKHPCECLHEENEEKIPEVEFTTSEVKEVASEVADKMIDNIETKGLNINTEEWKEDATEIVNQKVEQKVESESDKEVNESLEGAKEEELPADPEVVKADVHSTIADLVKDEVEAIDAYEEAKAQIADTHIEHKDDIIDTIDHIEDEEKEHVDELVDAATDIPFDKEETKEEKPVEETTVEFENDDVPTEEEVEFDEKKFENFINEWLDDNVEETKLFECLNGGIKDDGTIVLEGKLHLEEAKEEDVTYELTPVKEEMSEELLDSKHVSTYTVTSTTLPENLTYTIEK